MESIRLKLGSVEDDSMDTINDFQREQLELQRHFNTQLWTIPAVSLALVGLLLQAIDREIFISWWNLVVFITGTILLTILLLLFSKVHIQQLRLNELIKSETSEKMASFFSTEENVMSLEIKELEKKKK